MSVSLVGEKSLNALDSAFLHLQASLLRTSRILHLEPEVARRIDRQYIGGKGKVRTPKGGVEVRLEYPSMPCLPSSGESEFSYERSKVLRRNIQN